jgi:hypothetical protein
MTAGNTVREIDPADDYARLLIDWWNGGYERV